MQFMITFVSQAGSGLITLVDKKIQIFNCALIVRPVSGYIRCADSKNTTSLVHHLMILQYSNCKSFRNFSIKVWDHP